MNTIDSLKNFGRKALVGSLILTGLGTGCSAGKIREEKILFERKLGKEYTIKYIQKDIAYESDVYQFTISDSSGDKIIDMTNIDWKTNLRIKQEDDYTFNCWNGEIKYSKENKTPQEDSIK